MNIYQDIIEYIDQVPVTQLRLINANGVEAHLLTLGATLQAFLVPNEKQPKNIILGHDRPSDYLKNPLCAGQTIGRVAGRIKGGSFQLEQQRVCVDTNENGHCLHGGFKGFHKLHWPYDTRQTADYLEVTFKRDILEADDHFPGDLTVSITYRLDNHNRLSIHFKAHSMRGTSLFNPTNHVYFNLGQTQDLTNHSLHIAASHRIETDDELIPTGQKLVVDQTVYDFRSIKPLYPAIVENNGFDTAFEIDQQAIGTTQPIAVLQDSVSHDQISIYSDRNALVIYTMDSIQDGLYFGRDQGKEGLAREGIAMEAQTLPDAIHHNQFGDIILKEGDTKSYTICLAYEHLPD
ncbi:TPA: galactose mutarotase [Streptococcus equi subsp. zooepidemicus]|nr:galactose mutarotase [Streptococcus equi subsp. zooepidemicus]